MLSLTRKSDHLSCIDGLRGFCIAAVVFHHVYVYLSEYYKNTFIAPLAANFRFGVQMFFVLSAFLLFRQMNRRKAEEGESYFKFYLRRFFRTYPLWLAVCLYYYFFLAGTVTVLLYNLTFIFGFHHFIQIPQSWSLFVEELFYLTFPVLFLLVNSFRKSVLAVLVSFAVSILWKKYAVNLGVHDYGNFIQFSILANYQYFVCIWKLGAVCGCWDNSINDLYFFIGRNIFHDRIPNGKIWAQNYQKIISPTYEYFPELISSRKHLWFQSSCECHRNVQTH